MEQRELASLDGRRTWLEYKAQECEKTFMALTVNYQHWCQMDPMLGKAFLRGKEMAGQEMLGMLNILHKKGDLGMFDHDREQKACKDWAEIQLRNL